MDSTHSRRITLAAIVLTVGTGAIDVVSFTRLGGVFTSVMTANIALLGLSVALKSGTLAAHTALSIGCYVAGVAAAARAIGPEPAAEQEPWPTMITVVLSAELLLLAGLTAGWELTGGHPLGAEQYLLQGIAAAAMGMQAAAVRALGAGAFSTTYLTGQLTGLISKVATPGKPRWPSWRQGGPLLALISGALLSGLLIAGAPRAIPLVTFVPLLCVLAGELRARRQRADR